MLEGALADSGLPSRSGDGPLLARSPSAACSKSGRNVLIVNASGRVGVRIPCLAPLQGRMVAVRWPRANEDLGRCRAGHGLGERELESVSKLAWSGKGREA